MTVTPLTDANEWWDSGQPGAPEPVGMVVLASFARDLERRLHESDSTLAATVRELAAVVQRAEAAEQKYDDLSRAASDAEKELAHGIASMRSARQTMTLQDALIERQVTQLAAAQAEINRAAMRLRAADAMAAVVDDWVRRNLIDARSALADVRLDYGEPFASEEVKARLQELQTEAGAALASYNLLAEHAEKQGAEIERLKRWIDDLQSGMYVNCVYCGHRYGPGETTPVSMADALKAHVEQCQKHPLFILRRALDGLPEGALEGGWTWRGLDAYATRMEKERDSLVEQHRVTLTLCDQQVEEIAALKGRLEAARDALSRIKWVKDCGIDGTDQSGKYVNFTEQERDSMYQIASAALAAEPPAQEGK